MGSGMSPIYVLMEDKRRLLPIVMGIAGLCLLFYILGGAGKSCPVLTDGDPRYPDAHTFAGSRSHDNSGVMQFEPCDKDATDYTPCQDPKREKRFKKAHYAYRERHCPKNFEMMRCLIPPPPGYTYPLPWPESRQYAWYANAPHKHLTVEKAVQNWIRYEGERFFFPGGGTMFPNGADEYLQRLAQYVPLADGSIRTALDTGCGVASFGAFLLSRNVLTMSFAPRDTHQAQIQFALERGVPAMLGVMATQRQPYPSKAFDLAHCSRCLIPWAADGGMYLTEVDRLLRPGGYWVLSGPPVNWQQYWKGWAGTPEAFQASMVEIEEVAKRLCWTNVAKAGESGDFAVFQKPLSGECYSSRSVPDPPICAAGVDQDVAWETPMERCVSVPSENLTQKLANWPERLTTPPPRLEQIPGLSVSDFQQDFRVWSDRLDYYKRVALGELGKRRRKIRNIMDMNAGYGGFAAALAKEEVWVMNAVPSHIVNTLPIIYDRGLIGTYQNWCEAFSTYPRTYDLIHAAGLFSLYLGRCDMVDMLLEMDRILRPEGLVIVRDEKHVINNVIKVARGMRWEIGMLKSESEADDKENIKVLVCHKKYWVSS